MDKKAVVDDSEPQWRQFEKAVAQFLAASGPTAKVTHDKKQKDPDTGSTRQRDVWIEATLCDLFPIRALVSCKRWSSKLDAKDVEHFYGEYCGANVNLGIIYSHSGFTDTAIEKAKALGRGSIHCCMLYANQPPDIPEALILPECYCVRPVAHFSLLDKPRAELSIKTWGDVFALDETIIEGVHQAFRKLNDAAHEDGRKNPGFPSYYTCNLEVGNSASGGEPVIMCLTLGWKVYRAEVEAHILNGTYSLTADQFSGSQTTPAIDTQSTHPGSAWTLLNTPPPFPLKGVVTIIYSRLYDDDIQTLAQKPIVVKSAS